jgi:hypothetical protein
MKFTMFVTEDAVQFNLETENEHEEKFMGVLSEYQGTVELHKGVDVGLCQGSYLRNFGGSEARVLAVTIRRKTEDEPSQPPGSPDQAPYSLIDSLSDQILAKEI